MGLARSAACGLFALVLLVPAARAAAPDAVAAGDPAALRTERLARLVRPPPSPWAPDARRMLALMADLPLRRLFLSLGERVDWGPAHPRWRTLFPAFRDEYLERVASATAAIEAAVTAALDRALSDEELADLVSIVTDPELEPLLRTASRLGLDLDVAVRTTHLAAAPELYAPDEIARIKAELTKLQGRGPEMQALAARMQALSRRFDGPAFFRFQRVMIDTLLPFAAATVNDAEFRQGFAEWTDAWRTRIKENDK